MTGSGAPCLGVARPARMSPDTAVPDRREVPMRRLAAPVALAAAVAVAAAVTVLAAPVAGADPGRGHRESVRFATYNASLNRAAAGQLVADLSTPRNAQAGAVAEIIQRTRPDVLLVNEFYFDAGGAALRLFQRNYLSVSRNGSTPIF